MGVFWELGLNAGNESDAGKIKAYAKELNNAYKFPMADECEWGGLCFCDLGVNYGTTRPDNAGKFEELVEKVVAHFPEMKLHFYVNGDGAEYQWNKISKNGVLVDYEPWCMNIHCDGEYFKELLAGVEYIAQYGFEVSHNEAECSFDWKYDRISETEKCNSVLQHLSKQLPQVELICYKNEWKDGAPEISEYCIMMNGDGEWKEADDTMIDLAEKCVYGILEDKTTIFDIIKDARTCGL